MKSKDETGKSYGRLTVVRRVENIDRINRPGVLWLCSCECGGEKIVFGSSLRSGYTESCGCYIKDRVGHTDLKCGVGHDLNSTYRGMINRCSNKKNKKYKNYGGRGISVCERWTDSIDNFVDDMGERPTKRHSLDRIDNNGNYCKSNCRWATSAQQARNQRPIKNILSGVCIRKENSKQWRVEIGFDYKSIYLGLYDNLLDACCARKSAENKYWGDNLDKTNLQRT